MVDRRQQVSQAIWAVLERLALDEPDVLGAREVLVELDLDHLVGSPDSRASIRRELHDSSLRQSDWDRAFAKNPRQFRRRLEVLIDMKRRYRKEYDHRYGRIMFLQQLAHGLVHLDTRIVACAAETIRTMREYVPLTEDEADAARPVVAGLTDEWAKRWTEWGNASGPADREVVEDGIRRCYELSDEPWPGQVIWVDSPLTAALVEWAPSRLLWRSHEPRLRMDYELLELVGVDLYRQAEDCANLVWSQLSMRDALPHPSHVTAVSSGGAHLGATDPARVRRALVGIRDQLPDMTPVDEQHMFAAVESSSVSDFYPHEPGPLLATWLAQATLLLEVVRGPAGSLRDRVAAYRDANAAGPWTAHAEFVVVSERPVLVHSEHIEVAGQPHGRRQLHADNEPAVLWADGVAGYVVHGTGLPFDLMRQGWPIERILHERNSELRRIAIERLGWNRFLAEAHTFLIDGPVPDPGNPGNTLRLYDMPPVDGRVARLLLCTNASPERDGTVRRFGLHVPATIDTALAAAAWTFDVDPDVYQTLQRAT
jgi:hypothetical protein